MPDLISPCVLGRGPGALALNEDIVDALADAEEALLAPVGTPGIADVPVLLTVLSDAPTNNAHLVSCLRLDTIVTVDATSVVVKGLRHSHRASDRTALIDLLHHLLFAADRAKLVNLVDAVLVRDEAGLARVAIFTLAHGAATLAVVVAAGQVTCAGLIGDLILLHPLEGAQVEATVATASVHFTGDQNLRRDIDVWPGSLASDFNAIRQS